MQSIYIKALVCTIFLFCAVVSIDIASANEYRITVIAEGTGSTKMEALKSAWQNAVRQAVGMYMTSKTEMLNDNLTEELAAYSRGQVNSLALTPPLNSEHAMPQAAAIEMVNYGEPDTCQKKQFTQNLKHTRRGIHPAQPPALFQGIQRSCP